MILLQHSGQLNYSPSFMPELLVPQGTKVAGRLIKPVKEY